MGHAFPFVGKVTVEMLLPPAPVGVMIVVARNCDPILREFSDKLFGQLKFFSESGCREIAAQENEVDLQLPEEGRERVELLMSKDIAASRKPVEIAQNPLRKKTKRVPG